MRIAELVTPVVDGAGFDLVRVQVSGKKTLTVQIMAERADHTMTAEDCAQLSYAIAPVIEEADPVEGAYRLEVSSPGIDRPLVRPKDFHDWQGYEAKIELKEPVEGRKRFRGVLGGLDGENVCLDIEGETETALIPIELIASGKLVLTEALIRESLKAAKTARNDAETAQHENQNSDETEDQETTLNELQ